MKQPRDIIINVLKAQSDGYAMTAREIYNEMDPSEQGMFKGGHDGVSKTVGYMRTCGIVENGVSEIFNGRTVLTWRLKKDETKQVVAAGEAHDNAPDDMADEKAVLPDIHEAGNPKAAETTIDSSWSSVETAAENDIQTADDVQAPMSDSAIETLARDGYLVLDPFSETDQFICEVVNRLKTKPQSIGDKDLKIATLQNLAPLLSTDIHDVLMNIVGDLERLDEA